MRVSVFFLSVILISGILYAQSDIENNLDFAYQNAKKGIYWALSNIPAKKIRLENDLIADDKLYASVILDKEVNGVKITSRGYYMTYKAELVIFRSNESLRKDGYLKTEKKQGSD